MPKMQISSLTVILFKFFFKKKKKRWLAMKVGERWEEKRPPTKENQGCQTMCGCERMRDADVPCAAAGWAE
jgi:hypothetical protein